MPLRHPPYLVALCLLLATASLGAQDWGLARELPAAGRDPAVPTPGAFLGQALGQRYTMSADVLRYAEAVAAASDRVVLEPIGTTFGGRPLTVAVVTSPSRHEADPQRTELRAANQRLWVGIVEPDAPHDDHPVGVWFGMSIHGNEGSGVEAGMALLYHLASARDPAVEKMLESVVLYLDLNQNPDGHDRFVTGVLDRRSATPEEDPLAIDNQEPWPRARTNHYLFDMNRDWVLQTQAASRARVARVLLEKPQILADFHEMGSDQTYFFGAPPGPPVNGHISESVRELWRITGEAISARFDREGWPYFTGDVFPGDFPGYGGAWPCLTGAAGYTFEQASPRGGRVRRRDGSVLTLRDALVRHATAGLAVLEAATSRRGEIMEQYALHFRRIREEGTRDPRPWFLLTPRHDPDRLALLARTLTQNGIHVQWVREAAALMASPLLGGEARSVSVPRGTLLVSTRQALRPLVLTLLDPDLPQDEAFVKAELERLEAGRRSEIYDITAWNLPLLFGVETWRVSQLPDDLRLLPRAPGPAPRPPASGGEVAWLVPGRRLGASQLLAGLVGQGVRVGVAPFAFTAEGRSFSPGTLVVLADRNREHVARLRSLAAQPGSLLVSCKSAATPDGFDLGSSRIRPVEPPRIVVAAGEGTSAYSFGAVRWLFERAVPLRHTCVRLGRSLERALEEANVLVLPDGGYDQAPGKKLLEGFLERGGTLVALGGAVDLLLRKELELLPIKRRKDTERLGRPAGAIVRATLDTEHWLGHGLPAEQACQVRRASYWQPSLPVEEGRVVVRCGPGKDILLSGILPEKRLMPLCDSPLVIEVQHGRGRILAFSEDVIVRGAQPGLWKLFLNACLLGPSQGR